MRICSVLFSAIALATAVLGGGCTASPGAIAPAESGVSIPLVQQLNGNQYRLTANFEITEPDGTVLQVDGTADVPSVTVRLPPGIDVIRLLDGWTLSRSTDGGMTFTPVPAVLASFNPVNLIVDPNRIETWEFDFIVRDPSGQVEITFGAFEATRQLTGRVLVTSGSGDFAKYVNTAIQFAIYFVTDPDSSVEADGTHDLHYGAGITSLEFFNDSIGLLAPLATDFAGGFVDLTVRVHPDGTQDFSGSDMAFGGTFPQVTFGTGEAFLTLDANGFPADTSFFAFGMPFELSTNFTPVLDGTVEVLDFHVP